MRHFFNRTDRIAFAPSWGSPCPADPEDQLPAIVRAHVDSEAPPVSLRWVTTDAREGRESGRHRIGSYSISGDRTRWAVVDLDGARHHEGALVDPVGAAAAIVAALDRLGIPAYREQSGSGTGWHVWIFFADSVLAAEARRLLLAVSPCDAPLRRGELADARRNIGIEVFPKQDSAPNLGNAVWLPFWHGAASGGCEFYRPNAAGQLEVYLPDDFQKATEAQLRTALTHAAERQPVQQGTAVPDATPTDDLREGRRNTELFKLACRLFREGHADDALAMIAVVNETRCRPPLEDSEVAGIVASAGRQVEDERNQTYPYSVRAGRIMRTQTTRDGTVNVPLCNFTARIVEQVTADDGVEQRFTLAVEGQLASGAALPRVEVPAADFASMSWVMVNWGTEAVVNASPNCKDHLRAAMQMMSPDVVHRRVYSHIGWREIGDAWHYLHAGGAIGKDGNSTAVQVSLNGNLARYLLPDPPDGQALVDAVRASFAVMDLAPDVVTGSLLAAVYRSVLATSDFALHLAGPTGAGKSELAALCQQHFGAGLDARHLPGAWSSTANSLEALAFHAKDALLVVDDFAPGGSAGDVARLHREADRLVRAQGNNSGRGRCRPDGSLRPDKPPRGLILSTGEDVPRGQSLRARLWVLEVAPGSVVWAKLTLAQRHAADGVYAAAMSAYLRWLAPRIEAVRRDRPAEVAKLRDQLRAGGQHARTPGIAAELLYGFELFVHFAHEVGAVGVVRRDMLLTRAWQGIQNAALAQTDHVQSAEPAEQFLRLLAAAIASGRCHVMGAKGLRPASAGAWGWRATDVVTRDGLDTRWDPLGRCIGWLDGDDVYLEPDASYAAAQEMAHNQGESLPVSQQTLRKRLDEKGLLASKETDKLTQRRVLAGRQRRVLHLRVASLYPVQPGESGESGGSPIFPVSPVITDIDTVGAGEADSEVRRALAAATEPASPYAAEAGKSGESGNSPVSPLSPVAADIDTAGAEMLNGQANGESEGGHSGSLLHRE
jgi:hypothetical protein